MTWVNPRSKLWSSRAISYHCPRYRPTSKDSTYPASRFLYGEDVTDTTIVLDFNKAINPPCAFTDFAVCPLPPPENVLPFRIEAGEKRLG